MTLQTLTTGNGQPISRLGLGTVKLGRNEQVKYPQAFSIPDDLTAKKLLSTALSLGINIVDTAPAYGQSEERLGRFLINQRHEWHIVTKVGEEFNHGQSHFDFSKKHIRFSIERSLKRLRTDYLDTVLLHSNGNDVDIIQRDGALDTLLAIKREGLIRYIGVSTKTTEGGLLALNDSDIVMASYNLRYTEEEAVLKKSRNTIQKPFL
ncbi:MAG: aldo/keto reductase [Gammaproteobacteria bacterium]|nr:aldo/keto reductase [Gammaproteobacteria bacterium]